MQIELQRFLQAQENVISQALAELAAGRKQSHWMWFVFPQLAGLGHSAMAERYAIGSRAEAAAYLTHPVLGSRLVACTEALLSHPTLTAHQILGSPDDLKLRSSMTLFARVSPPGSIFHRALERFYGGEMDGRTLELLERQD